MLQAFIDVPCSFVNEQMFSSDKTVAIAESTLQLPLFTGLYRQ